MDAPTLEWLHRSVLPMEVDGMRVLEVGSMDVNGSVRPHIMAMAPDYYLGVDIAPGKGVDKVASVHKLVDYFGPASFDVAKTEGT